MRQISQIKWLIRRARSNGLEDFASYHHDQPSCSHPRPLRLLFAWTSLFSSIPTPNMAATNPEGDSQAQVPQPANLDPLKPPTLPSESTSPSATATLEDPRRTNRGPVIGWFTKLGSGIILDIKARAPYYPSDWTDAWNYRVVPATALIFFAKCVLVQHSVPID